ncbi:MAG: T9SS type A sorting domain-containing protein [Flavobacteriia bacterium]|nr:T9SS type A sorting domain-containing protein [Flavobacteriia bacterium]
MNKIFTCLLVTSLSVLSMKSFAQEEKHFNCGLGHQLKELYKQNPELEKKIEAESEKARLRGLEKDGADDSTVYIIPIVFHVLHYNGSEDISDAQVIDQVAILNRDYRLLNADTVDITPAFDTLKSDVKIEFRLATKDPWGNCTNGIEHIYTHLANNGDDDSKMNQWDRSRYLNVWVTNTIGEAGVAGYAFYPSAVDLERFYADGIIILNDYIGSIGTSSVFTSRALTHEIGHWMNLAHTWGNTNDPTVACGDDGVADTPETKGHNNCTNVNDDYCNPGIIENVQNYMEYSYCSRMFTIDQVSRMRNAITDPTANRSNLITASNHIATGIDLTTPPTCTPVAYFKSDKKMVCQGSSVLFTDKSWQATVTNRTWTFEDGTPATSTSATQSVTYNTPGFKKVTLQVSNSNGSDEIIEEKYIYVSPTWPDFTGPYTDNFDTYQSYFIVQNPEHDSPHFSRISGVGYNNSQCYKLDNYKNISEALDFSNEWFYYKRLGGSVDALISNSYDLRNTTSTTVSFKYAYATNASTSTDITETVKIYVSKDCGATWTLKKTLTTAELLTNGNAAGVEFVPTNPNQWKTYSFPYSTGVNDSQTRFKIEFTASDFSNNFYVDDFQVDGTLGLFVNEANNLELNVYPNPTKTNQAINVSYHANDNPVEFILRDIQGKVIHTETIKATNSDVNQALNVNAILSSSCYFLEVTSGNFSVTKKIIVMQ